METSENLAAGLSARFRLLKQESIQSVIFTNEGKSHERTKSEARSHNISPDLRCERMAGLQIFEVSSVNYGM
jgi:hypothetical protein